MSISGTNSGSGGRALLLFDSLVVYRVLVREERGSRFDGQGWQAYF